jgi:hypothetical protein
VPLLGFSRRRTSVPVPEPADDDDDELARGGYVFTTDADAAPMTLSAQIAKQADRIRVSGRPGVLSPGQYYLLGGPGLPDCEVILAEPPAALPGEPCPVRRDMCRTLSSIHPAGTPVTPVTVRFVQDWEQDPGSAGNHVPTTTP